MSAQGAAGKTFYEDLEELRQTFYEEATERLSELESLLLALEQSPHDLDLLNTIFRAAHSIKGGAGACDLGELTRFAHILEGLLDSLRKERLTVHRGVMDALLGGADVLAGLVQAARTDTPCEHDVDEAIARIAAQLEAVPSPIEEGTNAVDLSAGLVLFDDEPANDVAPPPDDLGAADAQDATAEVDADHLAEAHDARQRHASEPPAAPGSDAPWRERERTLEGSRLADELADGADASTIELVDLASGPVDLSADAAEPCGDDFTLADAHYQRIVDLALSLAAASARFVQSVAVGEQPTANQLDDVLHGVGADIAELEARLTGLRRGQTSTVIEGVVVRAAEQTYVVPLSEVEGYFRPEQAALRRVPENGEVLLTSDGFLPLIRLSDLLEPCPATPSPLDDGVAITLSLGGRRAALWVDHVLSQNKFLVKPLETNFLRVRGVRGATPLDGRLALVLDVRALLERQRRAGQPIQMR